MTLDQLRYFQAAAQMGSFSKAAETVHISQPSLSIAIKKLEEELQMKLFQENRKGAILTEAGRIFLQDIEGVFEKLDVAVTHASQFAEMDRAEIRIAYTASVSEVYIPKLLKGFLSEEGKFCCVYSDEMPTDRIEQGIREGHFDFGIGSAMPPDPEIEQIPIAYQRLCLLVPEDVADCSVFEDMHYLNELPFIHFRKDYPMYRLLNEKFKEWQINPRVIQYTYSESAIARLVEQGLGVGIVAETEGLEKYGVKRLYPAWLEGGRNIFLIRHRTRRGTQAAMLLQERILRECEER